MTTLAAGAVILAVAMALCGAVALVRLTSPLDRLHAGSFVTVAAGIPLVVAGFASRGLTSQSLKLAALIAILLVSGAVANHAVARAFLYRGGQRR